MIVDYLIDDNSEKVMDFIQAAKDRKLNLYTSELAVYEAIPLLIQEEYFRELYRRDTTSYRRIHRHITRHKIPVEARSKLIPKLRDFRKGVSVLGFHELPARVYNNAQTLSLTSRFHSMDALHVTICIYLAEELEDLCYVVSENTDDFNTAHFECIDEVKQRVKPLTPSAAFSLISGDQSDQSR